MQLDIAFNEQFHITTQWIARDHAGDFFEQNLEWAFLRWSPRSDVDIRVGRLGLDSYLLSDYRDVGYAYPWMRPPHEFYAYFPGSHFDGIDISQRYNLSGSYLTLKFFGGYVQSSTPVNDPLLNRIFPDINALASQLTTVNNYGHYSTIGGVYDDGQWLLQAEAAYAATNSLFITSQASTYLSRLIAK